MNNNKLRIKFELTDSNGNNYVNESYVDVTYKKGERGELDVIGEQLNAFLKQCGYARENDYIFMEDITEDEYAELASHLEYLRNGDDLNDD